MSFTARFAHVNLIARDWKELAQFYEQVLGCERMPPERDASGHELDEATGVRGAHVRGAHLRLPGTGRDGPTLEIFQYFPEGPPARPAINRPGFAHIAFAVDDVPSALDAVLAAGGGALGNVVSLDVPGAGQVKFVYATDPEGNIIELQQWSAR